MNRKQAIERGSTTYEGKPCSEGHGNVRYTKNCSCVECSRIKTLSRSPDIFRKYATSEKGRLRRKQYRKTRVYKDVQNRHQRKDYANNKEWYVNNHLTKLYGITFEEYNIKLEEQEGCCAICGEHHTGNAKRLSVDHCHKTGAIRKLLCVRCNTSLGLVKENIDILTNMINYIRDFK